MCDEQSVHEGMEPTMMTDTNISSTSEEVKDPITTDDDEIKLTLKPEIFKSPGRMEFAFDISSKTNDARRSIPVIRNENIKKGALLFDVTLPPGTGLFLLSITNTCR